MDKQTIAKGTLIICALVVSGCNSTSVRNTLSEYGFPEPTETEKTGKGTKVLAGGAGCVAGGAAGFFGTTYISKMLKKKGYNYADKEVKKAAMLMAGFGCIAGGKAALKIIENMDKKSKQAQEEAWAIAQQQSQAQSTRQPQAWKTDSHEGTVQIIDPVTTAQGRECATRKNYIKTDSGEAEQFIPVCKNGDGIYEQAQA